MRKKLLLTALAASSCAGAISFKGAEATDFCYDTVSFSPRTAEYGPKNFPEIYRLFEERGIKFGYDCRFSIFILLEFEYDDILVRLTIKDEREDSTTNISALDISESQVYIGKTKKLSSYSQMNIAGIFEILLKSQVRAFPGTWDDSNK